MRPYLKTALFTLCFFILGVNQARANIDQHCLSLCVSGGGSGTACYAQCSYIPSSNSSNQPTLNSVDKPITGTHVTNSHNVFETPTPTDGTILLSTTAPKKVQPDKDYACVNLCLKNGGQYNYCNQHCIKSNCASKYSQSGANPCKDLTGNAPGSAVLNSPQGGFAPNYNPLVGNALSLQ